MQIPKRLSGLAVAGLLVAGAAPAHAEVHGGANMLVSGHEVVARRTFSVTVTNTSNGETGCHNETTQSSNPGKCPKDY